MVLEINSSTNFWTGYTKAAKAIVTLYGTVSGRHIAIAKFRVLPASQSVYVTLSTPFFEPF